MSNNLDRELDPEEVTRTPWPDSVFSRTIREYTGKEDPSKPWTLVGMTEREYREAVNDIATEMWAKQEIEGAPLRREEILRSVRRFKEAPDRGPPPEPCDYPYCERPCTRKCDGQYPETRTTAHDIIASLDRIYRRRLG